MRKILFGFIICSLFANCNFVNAKFTTKNDFTGEQKINNVFLVVVSDKDTRACLNYYKDFLLDSLKAANIDGWGTFTCCRDKDTDVQQLIKSSLSPVGNYKYILTAVITKTVVGYGASSSRELKLDLYDVANGETTWSGTLKSDFGWFTSYEHYKKVANKLTVTTLTELRSKAIL